MNMENYGTISSFECSNRKKVPSRDSLKLDKINNKKTGKRNLHEAMEGGLRIREQRV